ncbi:MAG: hypothetical protein K2X48_07220 [Chitinophagaceae bacterium]|nr:hypothetical protein [Chitinophagaceae bacterium]
MKLFFIFSFLVLFKLDSLAQQMDTLYFFDHFAVHPINDIANRFKNQGTTIYFSKTDSIFLCSDRYDVKMKLTKYKDFLLWPFHIVIEGVRIIKPAGSPLTFQIKSEKQFNKKKYTLDTVMVFSSFIESPPFYWQPLREVNGRGLCEFCPDEFSVTNRDFRYKNNFKNPYIFKKLMEAVKYEYILPEGKLIQLKK